MANASLGEPLGLRHAVALWSAQSAYGTPVTPASSLGTLSARHSKRSANRALRGPGSPNLLARKGGSTYAEWMLRLPAIQSGQKSFLLKSARSAGALPLFTLGLGYQDDQGSPNRGADQIQDCKVDRLELSLDASEGHAPLSAVVSGFGGLVTPVTSLAPATLASTPWMSYEATLTNEGTAYPLRSFALRVDHHLSRDHVIPGSAPASFPRGHRYLTEHAETITGSISRYQPLGTNVQANTLSERDLILTLTNLDDAATLTLSLLDCVFEGERLEQDDRGLVWSAEFEARSFSLS
jgi:hypothetical protein